MVGLSWGIADDGPGWLLMRGDSELKMKSVANSWEPVRDMDALLVLEFRVAQVCQSMDHLQEPNLKRVPSNQRTTLPAPPRPFVTMHMPNSIPRRIDFLYADPKEYAFATLYFTGSKAFNTVMRQRALDLGYTLNEHGLSNMEGGKKGEAVDVRK